MCRIFFKKINNQNGVAAVEFAIIVPLLLVLTFGIIEFGILLFNKAMITNASREGARLGSLYKSPYYTDAEITTTVKNHLGSHLITFDAAKPDATVTVTRDGSAGIGTLVSVTVDYPYDFLVIPGFIPGIPDEITLQSATTMRVEE